MNLPYKYVSVFLVITILSLANTKTVQSQAVAALQPENSSILQYIMNERPVLVGLLTTAGLVPTLTSDSPYTLLAPPEKSLTTLKNETPETIRAVLAGHVLKGKYLEKDLKDGASVETLSGSKITICRKNGTLVNGVKMTDTNKEVRNGVVHQLQDVLK